jgi:hypothetical protein
MSKFNPSWLVGFRPRIPSQPSIVSVCRSIHHDVSWRIGSSPPLPQAVSVTNPHRQPYESQIHPPNPRRIALPRLSISTIRISSSCSTTGLLGHTLARRLHYQRGPPRILQLYKRSYSSNETNRGAQVAKDAHEGKNGAQPSTKNGSANDHTKGSDSEVESIAASVSKYLHFPKIPHRPTKEELLAAANGFWSRLKVRFKWASIRSMRPWNADEWGAFVSWFMLGHLVWILVGTTTFFSLLIFSINTVFAQGMFALPGNWLVLEAESKSRNAGKKGRRLLDTVCRRYSRVRVRYCAQVERRCHLFSQRVCLPPTWPN